MRCSKAFRLTNLRRYSIHTNHRNREKKNDFQVSCQFQRFFRKLKTKSFFFCYYNHRKNFNLIISLYLGHIIETYFVIFESIFQFAKRICPCFVS